MADRRSAESVGDALTLPTGRQRVELVYRWRVRQDALNSFRKRVIATIEQLVVRASETPGDIVVARICQPILGPAGDVWEVHLEFPNLQAAGRMLDDYERILENSPLWDLSQIGPVAELMESSAPLYRTVVFGLGRDDKPAAGTVQQNGTEAQPPLADGASPP